MLEAEFSYFIENQPELLKDYLDRYVVIKDNRVIGDYATISEAFRATSKHHELGTFLIQLCNHGDKAYTQTFNSRMYIF